MTRRAAHHERCRATWPQRVARGLGSFLEVLRVVVAPAHDDEVLDPATNEKLARGQKPEVAGAEVSCVGRTAVVLQIGYSSGPDSARDSNLRRRRRQGVQPTSRRVLEAWRQNPRGFAPVGPNSRRPWTGSAPRSLQHGPRTTGCRRCRRWQHRRPARGKDTRSRSPPSCRAPRAVRSMHVAPTRARLCPHAAAACRRCTRTRCARRDRTSGR